MIKEVGIDKLKPNNFFTRNYNEDKVKELANNIKVRGLIYPIEVDEGLTIITGGMRWNALKLLGVKKIKVRVLSGLTEFQKMCRCFSENHHRQNFTVAEEIEAVKKLLIQFKSFPVERTGTRGPLPVQKEFAKLLGVSDVWMSKILSLEEDAVEGLIVKVKSGTIGAKTAMKISKLPKEVQERILGDMQASKEEDNRLRSMSHSGVHVVRTHTTLFSRMLNWIENGRSVFSENNFQRLDPSERHTVRRKFEESILPNYKFLQGA